ncbi:Zinc finger protein 598 [Strongyloides ratti]|uniref:Zinc finger protein 598 n=1 Tax=Strongyloides ratti TaxID=34506 RepID=A0A090MZL2_STRRB|nr:Zinc finger protein 598 [Strongyloides ratti]CEF69129.1 Zinc finger protein 598 [Strongyloides ratti]
MDSTLSTPEGINTSEDKKKVNKRRNYRRFRSRKNNQNAQEKDGVTTNSSNLNLPVNDTNSINNIANEPNEAESNNLIKKIKGRNVKKRKRIPKKKNVLNEDKQDVKEEDQLNDKKIEPPAKRNDEETKSNLENTTKNIKFRSNNRPINYGRNINGIRIPRKKKSDSKEKNNVNMISGNNGRTMNSSTKENQREFNETEVSLEIVKNVMNINNIFLRVTKNVIPDLNWKQTCPICCEKLEFFGMLPCNHCICMLCLLKQSILVGESLCFLCRSPFKSLIFFKVEDKLPSLYPPININDCRRRYLSKNNLNFQRRNDIIFGCSLTVLAFDTILQHYCWVCHINNFPCIFKTFHELEKHYVIQHKRSFCSICVEYEQKLSIERVPFTSKELNFHLRGKLTPYDNLVTNDHAKCTFCPLKTFYNSENLFRHYRLQHQTCELCFRENNQFLVFDIFEDLLKHYEDKHFPCPIKNCKINGICFSSEIELQLHMSEVHSTTKKRQSVPLNVTSENGKHRRTTKNYQQSSNDNTTLNGYHAFVESNGFQMDQRAFPSLFSNPVGPSTSFNSNCPSFASIVAKEPPRVEEPSVPVAEVEKVVTSITVNDSSNLKKGDSSFTNRSNNDREDVSNILLDNESNTNVILPDGSGDLIASKEQLNENDVTISMNKENYNGDGESNLLNNNDCNYVAKPNLFWKMINFILFPFTAFQRAIANLLDIMKDFFVNGI